MRTTIDLTDDWREASEQGTLLWFSRSTLSSLVRLRVQERLRLVTFDRGLPAFRAGALSGRAGRRGGLSAVLPDLAECHPARLQPGNGFQVQ